MILLLGKNDAVEEYAKTVLKIDIEKDVVYFPEFKTFYKDFSKYINIIKTENPFIVTTQDKEMINTLLESDLNFSVWTVYKKDLVLVRRMSKEEAINACDCLGLDLRG